LTFPRIFRIASFSNPGNNDIEGDKWNGENFSWFSQTRAVEERFADGLKSGDLEGGWWDAGARLLNVLVVSPMNSSASSRNSRIDVVFVSRVVKRPYPIALAGLPVSSTFNPTNSAYTLKFTLPPTNIIPSVHPEPEEDTSFSSSNDPARAQDEATPATPAPLTSTETTIFFPSRVYGVRHSAEDVIMKCSEGRLEWNREEQRLVHYGKERWTKVSQLFSYSLENACSSDLNLLSGRTGGRDYSPYPRPGGGDRWLCRLHSEYLVGRVAVLVGRHVCQCDEALIGCRTYGLCSSLECLI
jgi:hypothetical protein